MGTIDKISTVQMIYLWVGNENMYMFLGILLTLLTLIVTVYDVINDNITPLTIVNVFLFALDIHMMIHTFKELKQRL